MYRLSTVHRRLKKKYFRNSGLFLRVFASLILLSFLMIFFLGMMMNGVLARNHRQQTAKANLNIIDQAAGVMDLTREVVTQSMRQMFWSRDFMQYMINPEQIEQDQSYRMIRSMQTAVDGSEFVKRITFYAPFSGMVYDSNSIIMEAERYDTWSVIDTFSDSSTDLMGRHNQVRSVLYAEDGRLFIVGDLRIPNYLGLFLFELDPEYTVRTMGLVDGKGAGNIYVFDSDSLPVFDRIYDYAGCRMEDYPLDQRISNGNGEKAGDITRGCYVGHDSEIGWTYIIPMDPKALSVGLTDFLILYLPLCGLFIILSSLFAYQISRAVYEPIDRLMKLAASSGSGKKADKDREVDYLTGVFSHAMDEQDHLRDIMRSIAPDILDSMLESLTSGKTLTEKRVSEILDGIGNPISLRGRFQVMACEIIPTQSRAVSDTELNLYILSLHNFAESIWTDQIRMYPIRVDRLRLSLLFCFPEDHPAAALKSFVQNTISRMKEQVLETTPLEMEMEESGIVTSLIDIRAAYREAAAQLHYQQYMESGQDYEERGETAVDRESEQEALVYDRNFYRTLLNRLIESAAQGAMDTVEDLTREMLAHACADQCPREEYINRVQRILDDLTQKTISLPLAAEDQQTIDSYRSLAERLRMQEETGDMEPYIMEYVRVTTRMIRFYNSKSRFRYIEQAKDFIAENYANSDLSLNMVGDRIGITGAYLSELFIEITGEKFSGYLAAFRVDKARQLLRSTNMPIKEIGFLCGFNSVQNFIRVFKKVAGTTPGQYRGGE